MQGLIDVTRSCLKHAAILLATGLLFQLGALHSGAQDKPKRPRITGIAAIRLYASNLGRSVDFYTQTLGLAPSGGNCTRSPVSCFPVNWYQQVELQPAASAAPNNWLAEISFATDDVSQLRAYLLAHGVAAGAISRDGGGPPHFALHDPEGLPVAFVQRPTAMAD